MWLKLSMSTYMLIIITTAFMHRQNIKLIRLDLIKGIEKKEIEKSIGTLLLLLILGLIFDLLLLLLLLLMLLVKSCLRFEFRFGENTLLLCVNIFL